MIFEAVSRVLCSKLPFLIVASMAEDVHLIVVILLIVF